MHWLEDDLPPDRTDLTRPDRHRAVRRRGRHLGRLARCIRHGDQPLNLRHRHHPPNADVSMSVPHHAPRGKSQDNPTPPVGAMNPRSREEPVGDSADGGPALGLPVASSTPRIWASHPASRRSNRSRRNPRTPTARLDAARATGSLQQPPPASASRHPRPDPALRGQARHVHQGRCGVGRPRRRPHVPVTEEEKQVNDACDDMHR